MPSDSSPEEPAWKAEWALAEQRYLEAKLGDLLPAFCSGGCCTTVKAVADFLTPFWKNHTEAIVYTGACRWCWERDLKKNGSEFTVEQAMEIAATIVKVTKT